MAPPICLIQVPLTVISWKWQETYLNTSRIEKTFSSRFLIQWSLICRIGLSVLRGLLDRQRPTFCASTFKLHASKLAKLLRQFKMLRCEPKNAQSLLNTLWYSAFSIPARISGHLRCDFHSCLLRRKQVNEHAQNWWTAAPRCALLGVSVQWYWYSLTTPRRGVYLVCSASPCFKMGRSCHCTQRLLLLQLDFEISWLPSACLVFRWVA